VAELRPLTNVRDPLKVDSVLKGTIFHEDAMLPLEPGDWHIE